MLNKAVRRDGRNWGKLMLLGGLLLFLFFSFGLTRELINRREANRKIADYQSKLEKIRMENEQLKEKIAGWENSGDLEASARAKLGLEKPGEQTVIILRKTDQNVAVKTSQEVVNLDSSESTEIYESNVSKWQKYFFGTLAKDTTLGSEAQLEN
jgi:cell division protein FtsB